MSGRKCRDSKCSYTLDVGHFLRCVRRDFIGEFPILSSLLPMVCGMVASEARWPGSISAHVTRWSVAFKRFLLAKTSGQSLDSSIRKPNANKRRPTDEAKLSKATRWP